MDINQHAQQLANRLSIYLGGDRDAVASNLISDAIRIAVIEERAACAGIAKRNAVGDSRGAVVAWRIATEILDRGSDDEDHRP